MIVLSGAALVLPDRMLTPGTLVVDGDRIVDLYAGSTSGTAAGSAAPGEPHGDTEGARVFAFDHHYIVPGFIDVHVHGVEGFDTLDIVGIEGGNPVASMAARLPRYGVTAFCPTTVACEPDVLARTLRDVHMARKTHPLHAARVLPAHLESNFISSEFRGAQPLACLRSPRMALFAALPPNDDRTDGFTGAEVLTEIERGGADVGIVTLAPELEGGLDLIRWLRSRGLRVSLGHSGATFEAGLEAIAAGARHATHLFNRMPALGHRAPGLAGAILQSEEIAAEVICDGYHVHPALVRTAVSAKGPSRMMAITDGTAVSGLPAGTRARLGGQPITAGESAAFLSDGTLAGSALTMDRAFRMLVGKAKLSIVDAATLCSTTAARELGLVGHGILARDAIADLVVLDDKFSVVQTYVAGQLVYSRTA
jgi:N-acetylglucosamine-6-phosphate deacetylase